MDADEFARVCLDPNRLGALGRAALGTLSIDELAAATGLSRRDALVLVGDLRASGLIDVDGALNREMLREIARSLPGREEPAQHILEQGEWTRDEIRVLSTFFAGDRLVEIPSNRAKRRIVLERLAQGFDPGDRYPEAEVSRRLEDFHPDYVALRRYLVDEGFLSRSEGSYWRTGGRFPLEKADDSEPADPTVPSPRIVLGTDRSDVELTSLDATSPKDLAEIANDERIPRFLFDVFPHPYGREDAEKFLAKATKEDPPISFAVHVDDALAGGVGGHLYTDIGSGSAEIGWWLNPAYWGRGIATSAVTRFVAYCFETLDLRRVQATVFVANPASARVAEKVGMVLEGISKDAYTKDGEVYDRLNYGLTRSEWCESPPRSAQ